MSKAIVAILLYILWGIVCGLIPREIGYWIYLAIASWQVGGWITILLRR